jgi:Protein of unknown function (DUF1059)
MTKPVRCECGFTARAADVGELVAKVRGHAWQAHQMALTPADARVLIERSDTAGRRRASRTQTGRDSEKTT